MSDPLTTFWAAAQDARARDVLAKLVLSAPRGEDALGTLVAGSSAGAVRTVTVRPVVLKAGPRLQLVYRYENRDVTRNLADGEAWGTLAALVPAPFHHLHLHTTERTIQLERRGAGWKRSEGPASHDRPASTEHDRQKQRKVQLSPQWTEALGLTDARGAPVPARRDKHRQVVRFVEVLDHWLGDAPRPPDGRATWLDVGSGNGALTFAAWDYLRHNGWPAAVVRGIELRAPLAEKCEATARALGCEGLSFVPGSISDLPHEPLDGLIALHACDTATDDALAHGVRAGATFLLAAPCCHKELRPALSAPPPLAAVFEHGILKGRAAEMVTDALRAALLGAAGYEARVFEFVSSEHTDKNLMISAVRRPDQQGPRDRALNEARSLATFYGLRHQRLADRLEITLS